MNTLEDRLYTYGLTLDEATPTLQLSSVGVTGERRRSRIVVGMAVGMAMAAVCGVVIAGVLGLTRSGGSTEQLVVGAAPPTTTQAVAPWTFPISGPTSWTDTYGAPRMVGTEYEQPHQGVDLFAPTGAPVVAITSGEVYSIGTAKLAGRRLWLRDASGSCYYYAHLASFATGLANGQTVRTGQPLGTVGTPPDTFGEGVPPHIHFEVHPDCTGPVNPTEMLRGIEAAPTPIPSNMTTVGGIVVHRDVAPSLTRVLSAARQAGFQFSGGGYRSGAGQIAVRKKNCGPSPVQVFVVPASKCTPPTAKPGSSLHEQGRAIDFVIDGRAVKADSAAHRWLVANAPGFGFTAKAEEPWHWEFRG
jgi:hypothetical protein